MSPIEWYSTIIYVGFGLTLSILTFIDRIFLMTSLVSVCSLGFKRPRCLNVKTKTSEN